MHESAKVKFEFYALLYGGNVKSRGRALKVSVEGKVITKVITQKE